MTRAGFVATDQDCPTCGDRVRQHRAGPRKVYCSGKCRARAMRRRKRGVPLDTPAATRSGLRHAAVLAGKPI